MKLLNIFIFQWFFVRLTRFEKQKIKNYIFESFDLMGGSRGRVEFKTYYWYSIQYWIVPCTGWFNDFIYLSNRRFWRISKIKTKK